MNKPPKDGAEEQRASSPPLQLRSTPMTDPLGAVVLPIEVLVQNVSVGTPKDRSTKDCADAYEDTPQISEGDALTLSLGSDGVARPEPESALRGVLVNLKA